MPSKSNKNEAAYLAYMRDCLVKLVDIDDDDWQQLLPYFSVVKAKKKTSLQAIGTPVTKHHFIVKGLVRLNYITLDGKDVNKGFYSEGTLIGNLSSLIIHEPSRFSIETIEACELVELDLRDFEGLFSRCPGWVRLFNVSCQMMLIRNERREAELLTMSARQRYLQFSRNFHHCIDRIPQYHIASYLGITATALSRYKQQWQENTETL